MLKAGLQTIVKLPGLLAEGGQGQDQTTGKGQKTTAQEQDAEKRAQLLVPSVGCPVLGIHALCLGLRG